jgi:hypothetical protein
MKTMDHSNQLLILSIRESFNHLMVALKEALILEQDQVRKESKEQALRH